MLGGHAVVESLRMHGVRHVFNVPGESFTSILDGLRDAEDIALITNRQEGGACLMAEAYAKATREVGVCVVTRGPGATNASIGVHLAKHDSTPLVLLVGQVVRGVRGREALQEIDYTHFFGSLAKWVTEVNDPRDIPQTMARAFHVARSGRPGPVVVSLPRDMLDEDAAIEAVLPYAYAKPEPGAEDVSALVRAVTEAKRPVIIAGSGTQYDGARDQLIEFSERFDVPVLSSYRRLDVFPNDHPNYLGNLSSAKNHARDVITEADLVLALGTRLNEPTTASYSLPPATTPLIQVYPDAGTIGQNTRPELGIVADVREALVAALEHPAPDVDEARRTWIARYRAEQEQYATQPERPSGAVSQEHVMADLKRMLPADAIQTVDAGNFALWVQRYQAFCEPETFFGPTVGSMGFGIPAAVGAKLAHPERVTIAHCGDGGFLMTGQELATAAEYGVNVIVIVYNNHSYSTIRMHQEAQFPGRPSGTDVVTPDYAALGEGYGALGLRVSSDEEFAPALEQALNAGRPVVIEVTVDLESLSPTATLADVTAGKAGR